MSIKEGTICKCFLFIHGAPGRGLDFQNVVDLLKDEYQEKMIVWAPNLNQIQSQTKRKTESEYESDINASWRYQSMGLLATTIWELWEDELQNKALCTRNLDIIICRHSAGCPIAWEMVLQRPPFVSTLVLLSSIGPFPHNLIAGRIQRGMYLLAMWGFPGAAWRQKKVLEGGGLDLSSNNQSIEAICSRVYAYNWPRHREVLSKRLSKIKHLKVLQVVAGNDVVVDTEVQLEACSLLRESFRMDEESRFSAVILPSADHAGPLRKRYVTDWVPTLISLLSESSGSKALPPGARVQMTSSL